MKKLFILTNASGKMPQKILELDSIRTGRISEYLNSRDILTETLTYDELFNNIRLYKDRIKGSYFFYASSQVPEYYSAFEDALFFIESNGGILIPGLIHFRAHENKFIQEMVKAGLEINTPGPVLISSLEEGLEKLTTIKYPVIAKLASGYGSRSVFMLNNEDDAEKFLNKHLTPVIKPRKNLLKYRKEIERTKGNHPLKVGKIVFQQYISGVENDWKIIVFGDRLFYLKRYTRDNDFRASGSGKFDGSIKPDADIVSFAYSVRDKLNVPWVSLDIIKKDGAVYLIEYQCVHFGLYTVMKSEGHFLKSNGAVTFKEDRPDEDILFAEEIFNLITEK